MGERWVWYYLDNDETLKCTSCSRYLYDQRVYMYLDVNDGLDDVMCERCWNKDQKGVSK